SADTLRLPIFFPTGPGQITAHDAFDRERCGFAHDHGTAGQLVAEFFQVVRKLIEICGDKMILDLVKTFEPECRNLIQDCAFEWNRIWQNNIKGGEAIADNEEESIADVKDFTHFAAA